MPSLHGKGSARYSCFWRWVMAWRRVTKLNRHLLDSHYFKTIQKCWTDCPYCFQYESVDIANKTENTVDFHFNELQGQQIFFFRSSNSLEADQRYKEIPMKGNENQFFRRGNSLEAILLEWESTVYKIEQYKRGFCFISIDSKLT